MKSLGAITLLHWVAVAIATLAGVAPTLADPNESTSPPGTGAAASAGPRTAEAGGTNRDVDGGLPSESPLPSCLDRTIRDELGAELKPRGVQKRDFRKDKHFALAAHAGLYGGDLTSSNWLAGGSLQFWFTEDFGIEAAFNLTPVVLDLDAPLAKFFGDDRFENSMGYLGLANLVWSPIHAKLKVGDGIMHADILAFAGAGRLFHPSVQGVSADAGMALELFVSKPVTLRFDVRNVIAIQEAAGETRITNNLVTTAAVVFWIPTWL
ncbi:MAG: outer membrane beta-barrel domain-containing protein [Kofleriaceae bacterium]|nr:outer membrane beta-barrel domain-containing protein [Kofleriaceae bacterium]